MADNQDSVERGSVFARIKSNWGSLLFVITLISMLIFFWWLLIYSGGVTVHHG